MNNLVSHYIEEEDEENINQRIIFNPLNLKEYVKNAQLNINEETIFKIDIIRRTFSKFKKHKEDFIILTNQEQSIDIKDIQGDMRLTIDGIINCVSSQFCLKYSSLQDYSSS